MKTRFGVYSCLGAVVLLGGWLTHVAISTPLQIPRWRYPLDALVSNFTVTCDASAPAWMQRSIRDITTNSGSLANQLAYLSPNGELFECRNGWRGGILRGDRVENTTPFRIASLTKFFTAYLASQAQKEGKLNLSASITKVLPDIQRGERAAWDKVTGIDLLRHSFGMDRLKQQDPMLAEDKAPPCPSHLDRLNRAHFDFEPGHEYAYGNLGYCMMGVIVERAFEMPYRQLVHARFDREVRMPLQFTDGPAAADEVTYDTRFSDFWTAEYYKRFDLVAFSAVGGVKTNAGDLARIVKAERPKVIEALSEGNRSILRGYDCSKFMECYGALGAVVSDGERQVNVWRGNLVGSASMLVIAPNGAAIVWLGSGWTPTQQSRDERVFRAWLHHLD